MGFDSITHALEMTIQVFFLDLVLSGDNALLIALACRHLPLAQRRQVVMIGTCFAFLLRVVLTSLTTFLLLIPSLRLVGGVALLYIAIKLLLDDDAKTADTALGSDADVPPADSLWPTVSVVLVADLVMSMDNVVALAAVAQDHLAFLILGLLLSIPLLMFGSLYVANWLKRYPILVPAVGALLGWIAGDIAVSDPLIADWVNTQSPALTVVVPMLCAVFVILQSKILEQTRQKFIQLGLMQKPELALQTPGLSAAELTARSEAVLKTALSDKPSVTEMQVDSTAVKIPVATAVVASIDVSVGAALPERAAPAEQRTSATPLRLIRGKVFMFGGAAVFFVGLYFLSHFGRSFIPAPSPLTRFDCPGFTGTFSLYYKHGGDQIQLRKGGYVINGRADYGKLIWEDSASLRNAIGFTLPDEIITDSPQTIQINGGSFRQISCSRGQ